LYLCICVSVYLCICVSVYLCICVSVSWFYVRSLHSYWDFAAIILISDAELISSPKSSTMKISVSLLARFFIFGLFGKENPYAIYAADIRYYRHIVLRILQEFTQSQYDLLKRKNEYRTEFHIGSRLGIELGSSRLPDNRSHLWAISYILLAIHIYIFI